MKKELKEILENNDLKKMKEYLDQNKVLDYMFSVKMGDYTVSLNPLMYSLLKNKDAQYSMAKLLVKEMNNLDVKDFFTRFHGRHEKEYIFGNAPDEVLSVLYKYLNNDEKKLVSTYLARDFNFRPEDSFRLKYVLPAQKLEIVIKQDDGYGLNEFLAKNPDFIMTNLKNKNYLEMCVKEQAVFCFDILKDHIKAEKTAKMVSKQVVGSNKPKV